MFQEACVKETGLGPTPTSATDARGHTQPRKTSQSKRRNSNQHMRRTRTVRPPNIHSTPVTPITQEDQRTAQSDTNNISTGAANADTFGQICPCSVSPVIQTAL